MCCNCHGGKKALVIQQVAHEGLGIIGRALLSASIKPDFINIHAGQKAPRSIKGYCALIVMGGPMGVYETEDYPFIKDELRLIEGALKDKVPTLGVCLGAQLLAHAAGGRVYKGRAKEIGWYDVELTPSGLTDKLLLGLPAKMKVFQWHGDTFDVPAGAVNLASSPLFENQLIRVGENAYGVQFHLEVTGGMVEEWIAIGRDELKALKEIDPKKILKDTPVMLPELHTHGGVFISRFLRLLD